MSRKSGNRPKNNPNYTAQRWFIGITFVMTFISAIGAFGSVYWFYLRAVGGLPDGFTFATDVGVYFIIIFMGYLVGLIGLLKPQPPLHHAATISSMINVVISAIIVFGAGNSQGVLIGLLTALHVYLAFRFPIDFTSAGERILG